MQHMYENNFGGKGLFDLFTNTHMQVNFLSAILMYFLFYRCALEYIFTAIVWNVCHGMIAENFIVNQC